MAVFGSSVPVVRLSDVTLQAGFLILSAFYIQKHWGDRVALIAVLFLAIPGFHVLEWSYQPIGGYSIMMAAGMGAVILADDLPDHGKERLVRLLALGLLLGLGLWSNQMMIVFVAAALVPLLVSSQTWAAARASMARVLARRSFPPGMAFNLIYPALIALGVGGFFVSGCQPVWRFARVETIARWGLAACAVGIGAGLLPHVSSKRHSLQDGLSLAGGFLVGFAPIWTARITGALGAESVLHPSCPTGVVQRASLLVQTILPALWGIPSVQALVTFPLWQALAWLLVILLAWAAIISFFWARRLMILRAWRWDALDREDKAGLGVLILFSLPLALSLLGNNTVDVYSVRHLLITGLASAVMFGLAIDRVLDSQPALGAVLGGFWVAMVAVSTLYGANGRWHVKFTEYDSAGVDALVTSLDAHGVDAAYADFWGAYTLDYLSGERIAVVPYNTGDRYPAYTERLQSRERFGVIFPGSHAPTSGIGTEALVDWLRRPNEISGEGPAEESVIQAVQAGHVEDQYVTGPWDVWIVVR